MLYTGVWLETRLRNLSETFKTEEGTLEISVVIRTKDKERYFDYLLENLASQTLLPSEIIVVDNHSDEKKLRLLERDLRESIKKHSKIRKIKLIPISNAEFSHAYSTNLGVSSAENELVCITNAHSLPVSLCWLEDGAKHFEDANVAGVSGFFIPHREGNVFGKLDPLVYLFPQRIISRQGRFSTINCIIRKSLWEKYPFDENLLKIIPETRRYGLEDYDWSKEMVARGFKIIIESQFSVFHSHYEGLDEMSRNVWNYFVYRKIQRKIDLFARPRKAFTKVFGARDVASETVEISVH
jgi:glycosyltransferase involved in cell wall biosynthesis